MKALALISLLFLAACASNPNKAQYINTNIDHQARVNDDAVIGVKDGNLVFQKKIMIGEELRKLQFTVYELEANVYGGNRYYGGLGKIGVLRHCRELQSDVSNGGDGKLAWTEPREYVVPEDDFTIGLNEKDAVIGVSEEFLKDRIARFKQYKQVLEKRSDDFEQKISICEIALKSQKNSSKEIKAQ